MIPEGWKATTIGQHAEVLTGFAFKSVDYTSNESDVRLLRGDNIAPHRLRWRDVKRFPKNRLKEVSRYQLRAGDFVVAMDRTWLPSGVKIAEITAADLPCLLVQRVARLRAKDTLHQGLMKQFFSGHQFDHHVQAVQTQTAVPHISPADLRDYPIKLPPLAEQKRIAEILSTWDRAIETTEKLIANSEAQKKALMQQLLTGRKRLPGFSGEWKSYKLSELEDLGHIQLGRGNVISRKDISSAPGPYPIYSSSVMAGGLFGTYGNYMFEEELITWSVDGGGDFFYRPKHKFSVTNVCGWMRLDTSAISYLFLAEQLQFLHSSLNFDYQTKAHPSVIRQVYVLGIPPLDEQRAIGETLMVASLALVSQQSALCRLKTEKSALMQQLLTGKRRVKIKGEAQAA